MKDLYNSTFSNPFVSLSERFYMGDQIKQEETYPASSISPIKIPA